MRRPSASPAIAARPCRATGAEVRGRGLHPGAGRSSDPAVAGRVCRAAFARGLVIETSGPECEVVKLLPPLTIGESELADGLEIIADAVEVGLTASPADAEPA